MTDDASRYFLSARSPRNFASVVRVELRDVLARPTYTVFGSGASNRTGSPARWKVVPRSREYSAVMVSPWRVSRRSIGSFRLVLCGEGLWITPMEPVEPSGAVRHWEISP